MGDFLERELGGLEGGFGLAAEVVGLGAQDVCVGALAGGLAELEGEVGGVECFAGLGGGELDAAEFAMVAEAGGVQGDGGVEVGGGFFKLTEGAVGDGALEEVLGCGLGFDVSGELLHVVFRALVGGDR